MKKIVLILMVVFLVGCRANVMFQTVNSRGKPMSANVQVIDEDGAKIIHFTTNDAGERSAVIPYGSYTIKANKEGYDEPEGILKVDLLGHIAGISVQLALGEND